MTQHPHRYQTKYKLDSAVAIILMVLGICIISVVFGMMLFPVFTKVCADELLLGVARVGYGGVATLCIGVLLECYNLYEHHKPHVAVLAAVSLLAGIATVLMIHYVAQAYSCIA